MHFLFSIIKQSLIQAPIPQQQKKLLSVVLEARRFLYFEAIQSCLELKWSLNKVVYKGCASAMLWCLDRVPSHDKILWRIETQQQQHWKVKEYLSLLNFNVFQSASKVRQIKDKAFIFFIPGACWHCGDQYASVSLQVTGWKMSSSTGKNHILSNLLQAFIR